MIGPGNTVVSDGRMILNQLYVHAIYYVLKVEHLTVNHLACVQRVHTIRLDFHFVDFHFGISLN